MTKIGEVPPILVIILDFTPLSEDQTSDHQDTVGPIYGQFEAPLHPFFGQFIASLSIHLLYDQLKEAYRSAVGLAQCISILGQPRPSS